MNGKEVIVMPRKQLTTGCLTWADQILVATNATRHSINNQMRQILGYEGLPQDGERMICLKNYWDDLNDDGDSLVNGTTGIIRNPFETFRSIPRYIQTKNPTIPIIQGEFYADGSEFVFESVSMDKKMIMEGEPFLDWKISYQLGKLIPKIGDIRPKEFAFAYAITCHKAQGSEWDKVLTIEENFPFDRIEHARWLYTAVTRAAEKKVLVRPE